jgi:hypothetical protein
MRIVARVPYESITPEIIEQIEHNTSYGYAVQVILDAKTQTVLLVVE